MTSGLPDVSAVGLGDSEGLPVGFCRVTCALTIVLAQASRTACRLEKLFYSWPWKVVGVFGAQRKLTVASAMVFTTSGSFSTTLDSGGNN